MEGYYMPDVSGKGLKTPTGRLRIEAKNLPVFEGLLDQAKKEADQLQRTINQLSLFELSIDFVDGSISEES